MSTRQASLLEFLERKAAYVPMQREDFLLPESYGNYLEAQMEMARFLSDCDLDIDNRRWVNRKTGVWCQYNCETGCHEFHLPTGVTLCDPVSLKDAGLI